MDELELLNAIWISPDLDTLFSNSPWTNQTAIRPVRPLAAATFECWCNMRKIIALQNELFIIFKLFQ